MIEIVMTPKSLTLSGHAGAGPYGKDLVCAGVTVLARTLEAALRPWAERGEAACSLKEGYGAFTLTKPVPETEAILNTLAQGFRLLAEEYPEYVRVSGISSQ